MALIDISKFKDRKTVVTSAYKDTSLKQAQYPYHEFCQELSKLSAKSFSEYHTRFARVMYEDALNGEDSELFRFAYNAVKGKRNIVPFKDKHKLAVHVIDKAMPLFHADNFIRVNYMGDSDIDGCISATATTLRGKTYNLPISMKDLLSKFVVPYMKEYVLPRVEFTDEDKRFFDVEANIKKLPALRNMVHGVSVTMLPISVSNGVAMASTYYLPKEKDGSIYVNDVNHSYVGTLSSISTTFHWAKDNVAMTLGISPVDSDIYDKLKDYDNHVYELIKGISRAIHNQGLVPQEERNKEKLIEAFIKVDTRSLPSSDMLLHIDDVAMRAILDKYEPEQIVSWYKRIIGFQQLDTIKNVKLLSSSDNGGQDASSYVYTDLYEYPFGSPSEDAEVSYVFKNRVLYPLKNAIGNRIYDSMTEGILSILVSPLKTDRTPWLKIIDSIWGVNYQKLCKYNNLIGFRTPQVYSYIGNNNGVAIKNTLNRIELTYLHRIETKFNF